MNANDYRPGEYGSLTPNPEGEREEKKKKKKSKRTVIALAGLAALLAAGGCCVGSGLVQKIIPPREEETVVVEPADDVYVAPTSVPTGVPTLAPTPVPRDVRESWYGNYIGWGFGRDVSFDSPWDLSSVEGCKVSPIPGTDYICEFAPTGGVFWLEIISPADYRYGNATWGLDMRDIGCPGPETIAVSEVELYLPANLSEAPNLTITNDTLHIAPTDEQPYELFIRKGDGRIEGYLHFSGDRFPERWMDASSVSELDQFEAHGTSQPDSCIALSRDGVPSRP